MQTGVFSQGFIEMVIVGTGHARVIAIERTYRKRLSALTIKAAAIIIAVVVITVVIAA